MRRVVCFVFAFAFTLSSAAFAQTATETVIYNFDTGTTNAQNPYWGLIQGSDGNYYGTSQYGGANGSAVGDGSVYKLTVSGGTATLALVYSFCSETSNCGDGDGPTGGVIEGPDGLLYGATPMGGADDAGVVYSVTRDGATYNNLHSFIVTDGNGTYSGVIEGVDGSFYGATAFGGGNEVGEFYNITSTGSFSPLYSFSLPTGEVPYGLLIQGSDGNFYGTTVEGGGNGGGGIFKVTPSGAYTQIYSFTSGTDGGAPRGGLVEGSDGNFYGTTSHYGNPSDCSSSEGCGTIFKYDASTNVLTTLYSFTGATDGGHPQNSLFLASDGNLYGTAESGSSNDGTIYSITPSGTFTLLVQLPTSSDGGRTIEGPLVQGNDGNLYGTAMNGGANGYGAAFQVAVTPAPAAPVQLSLSASSVAAGSPVTLSWKVLNAFSDSMQLCNAYVQGGATGAGTWTGQQTGTYSSSTKLYSGSASITPTSAGTYTYALTCGGQESGFASLTVTGSSKTNSTTTLSATPNPASVGQTVTLKATVTGSGATPTGSVSFLYSTDTLETKTLSSGSASFAASSNGYAPGAYVLTASYAGNTSYNASTSAKYTVTLTKAPTATTLTASPSTVTPPADVTLTATVKRSASGAAGTPAGSVTFSVGTTTIGTVTLNGSGVAKLTAPTTGIAAGMYSVTAKYNGDGSDTSSTSAAVTVTVE